MNGLLIRYKISGGRLEYLLKWLHDKNVEIRDVKVDESAIFLTIEQKDSKKLFAISSNMCYNIKKIGYKGKYAPIKILSEKIGLAIGGILFIIGAVISDNSIKDVVYLADAAEFKSEIEREIAGEITSGVFRVFENDYSAVAERIAKSSEEIAFISVKKSGKRLIVEAHRAKEEPQVKAIKKDKIVSTVNGTVGRITVLGGTARVGVGDEVKAGDVIIDGGYTHGDKSGETYALGEAEIICEYEYEYEGVGEDAAIISRAKALALTEVQGEIKSMLAEVKNEGERKTCVVKVLYSVWIYE